MKLLLKKAERKKKRRKNHYNTENILEIKNMVDSKIKEEISALNNTNCEVSLYNKSIQITRLVLVKTPATASHIPEFSKKPCNKTKICYVRIQDPIMGSGGSYQFS